MNLKYRTFKTAYPFLIKVPFSELEIYFDNRLKPLIINNILNFEIDYLYLSHRYGIGIPYDSIGKKLNVFGENYLRHIHSFMLESGEINFFLQSLISDKITYAPLVSKISYFNSEDNLIENYIIDIDNFEGISEYQKGAFVNQSPFDGFSEGFSQRHIEECQDAYELNYIMLHFGIRSNIFYPYIENDEGNAFLDNRIIAYRNAPRYNSLLRGVKKLCKKYGFSIDLAEGDLNYERSTYETVDGILLDGKIIYQEDIEDGTIKLPCIDSF